MYSAAKIKIRDDSELRKQIFELFDKCDHKISVTWSLEVAKHALKMAGIDYESIPDISNGFLVIERWQCKEAVVCEVRQAALKIHGAARRADSEIIKAALRAAGHAVASGHMKDHVMVASDYAVKMVEIMFSGDDIKIAQERKWQLEQLEKIMLSTF